MHVSGPTWIEGEFLEVDPPRRLVIAWGFNARHNWPAGAKQIPPGSTRLEVTLIPDGEATILRLRHTAAGQATPALVGAPKGRGVTRHSSES